MPDRDGFGYRIGKTFPAIKTIRFKNLNRTMNEKEVPFCLYREQ
jgi:hypothetical protein